MRLVIAATAVVLGLTACGGARSGSDGSRGQPSASSPTPSITPAPGTPTPTLTTAGPKRVVVIPDRANDVVHTLNEGDDNPKHVSEPRADLRRIVITYGRTWLQVRERIGDLQPIGFQQYVLQLHGPGVVLVGYAVVRDSQGQRGRVFVDWERGHRASGLRQVRCPGASARADLPGDQLIFTVSTECLGTPPWVRVIVSTTLLEPNDEEYDDTLDADRVKSDGYSARVNRP